MRRARSARKEALDRLLHHSVRADAISPSSIAGSTESRAACATLALVNCARSPHSARKPATGSEAETAHSRRARARHLRTEHPDGTRNRGILAMSGNFDAGERDMTVSSKGDQLLLHDPGVSSQIMPIGRCRVCATFEAASLPSNARSRHPTVEIPSSCFRIRC
jgi:hypothetical protein